MMRVARDNQKFVATLENLGSFSLRPHSSLVIRAVVLWGAGMIGEIFGPAVYDVNGKVRAVRRGSSPKTTLPRSVTQAARGRELVSSPPIRRRPPVARQAFSGIV